MSWANSAIFILECGRAAVDRIASTKFTVGKEAEIERVSKSINWFYQNCYSIRNHSSNQGIYFITTLDFRFMKLKIQNKEFDQTSDQWTNDWFWLLK